MSLKHSQSFSQEKETVLNRTTPDASGLQVDGSDGEKNEKTKRWCGVRRKIFWLAAGLLLLLIAVAVVAGVVASLLHEKSEAMYVQNTPSYKPR